MERKEELLKKFGQRLAALRQQKNLSVRELADAAGLAYRRVQLIEAGKVNLLFTTILALARALGISPDELL
ncbi:MAG TPA: helix-turn-helix transcriptional regulator [Puia sp.]|nr:helix-turn-helix transcriptional regulator [Puia sp.]